MILTKEQREELEKVVRPIMKYLGNTELFSPYVSIVIDNTHAKIIETDYSFMSEDYLPD